MTPYSSKTLIAASVTARFNQAYNGAFPTNTQASPRDCFRGQGDEGALERLVPLVIELRFFGGLTSRRRRPCSASHPMPFTPSGDWAKAWLQGEMKAGLRDT